MYDWELGIAEKLTSNIKTREPSLHYKIHVIDENKVDDYNHNGVYILIGTNQKAVENISSSYMAVIDEYCYQQSEAANVFAQYTIFKIEGDGLANASMFFNKRNEIELIGFLCEKYGVKKTPYELTQNDFQSIYTSYVEIFNEKSSELSRSCSQRTLEYQLKIIDGGLTQEEYNKKHGPYSLLSNKKIAEMSKKTIKYKSRNLNCIEYNNLVRSAGELKTVDIDHNALPYFEESMKKYNRIYYFLIKESKVSMYGYNSCRVCHTLTFPALFENIIAAEMHKAEHKLDDISKRFRSGMSNVWGTQILESDFRNFYNYAQHNGVHFYLDETGKYAPSTTNKIGIAVESQKQKQALVTCLNVFYNYKLNDSFIEEADKIRLHKNIYQN